MVPLTASHIPPEPKDNDRPQCAGLFLISINHAFSRDPRSGLTPAVTLQALKPSTAHL